jgi:hypothetical protein
LIFNIYKNCEKISIMYTKGCQNKAMKEKIPKSKFLSQVISLKSKHKQV